MKTIFKSLLLLAVCTPLTFANNGSPYSRYGIGEVSVFSTSRAEALGGASTGLSADGYVNLDNPASLGTITRTLFNGAYQYRGYQASDGTNSSFLNAGGFLGLSMAFPVYKPYGIVFGIGLAPVTSVGYHFNLQDTYGSDVVAQSFDGKGALSALQMGLSYSPGPDLFLGVTADYNFGTITNEQTLSYPNTTYYASDVIHTMTMSGFGFRLGLLHTGVDKALGLSSTKHLSLGLSVSLGSSISTTEELLQHRSTSDTTFKEPDGTLNLPFGASVGIAYQSKGMLYTGELQMQQWGDFKASGVHPLELQNSMRLGGGVEWLPGKEFVESYWQQVSYRLGAYAGQTDVIVNKTSINEYFATAGIGLPLGNEARVNLGLEYGVRGTTSASLVKNNIIRFTLSVSAGDIWFIPSEIE